MVQQFLTFSPHPTNPPMLLPLTSQNLQAMSRAELQKLAKDHNIKGNLKSEAIREKLLTIQLSGNAAHDEGRPKNATDKKQVQQPRRVLRSRSPRTPPAHLRNVPRGTPPSPRAQSPEPEAEAHVLENTVAIMREINELDRRRIDQIASIRAQAAKLRDKAADLRLLAKSERARRERIEKFFAYWVRVQPRWGFEEVWSEPIPQWLAEIKDEILAAVNKKRSPQTEEDPVDDPEVLPQPRPKTPDAVSVLKRKRSQRDEDSDSVSEDEARYRPTPRTIEETEETGETDFPSPEIPIRGKLDKGKNKMTNEDVEKMIKAQERTEARHNGAAIRNALAAEVLQRATVGATGLAVRDPEDAAASRIVEQTNGTPTQGISSGAIAQPSTPRRSTRLRAFK